MKSYRRILKMKFSFYGTNINELIENAKDVLSEFEYMKKLGVIKVEENDDLGSGSIMLLANTEDEEVIEELENLGFEKSQMQ